MELKTGTIDIGTFHKLYTTGVIKAYPKNRGGRIFNQKAVNKYAKQWDTASSGDVVVEKVKDGYMLRDFHNRAEAIKIGVNAGTIKKTENLLIRVIPPGDGLSCYKNINSAAKHTARERLSNTDFCFGAEIEKILKYTTAFSADSPVNLKNFYFHGASDC